MMKKNFSQFINSKHNYFNNKLFLRNSISKTQYNIRDNSKILSPLMTRYLHQIPKKHIISPFIIKKNISSPNSHDDNKHKELFSSTIRLLNIGKNYFRHINPRKKKILLTLLNSYIKQFKTKENQNDVVIAFDLYYNNEYKGKPFSKIEFEDMELTESLLWHFNSIMILDRIASQYSRFEFMEYDQIINSLNALPKEKRDRAKYIFTNHPNQPNSINQLFCINEIFEGLQENDLNYLDIAMTMFREENLKREFNRPSILEELVAYYSSCIPDLIQSLTNMYELGLKDLKDFFEIPETALIFKPDSDSPKLSLMTFIHGLSLKITVDQYIKLIEEADLRNELIEVINSFEQIKNYGLKLMEISHIYRKNKLTSIEFFESIPVTNISGIESHLIKNLSNFQNNSNRRVAEISKKILSLISVFRLIGCQVLIRIFGKELKIQDPNNLDGVKTYIHDILKEISILNSNVVAGNLILFDYESLGQYEILKKLLAKYQLQNLEIVPILESSKLTNETESNITAISSSETRQRDGILLTELRYFREYINNPKKWLFMGQGNTAERGGGPFGLTHLKYNSMTRVQRERHIRTIEGYYFTSEFCSKDLIFAFLLNGAMNLNIGDHFEPTSEYLDFLFELDSIIGQPQRDMQKTKEFNDLYANNTIVKNLVENYTYGGAEDNQVTLDNIKEKSPIVQSYIFSDRCSFTHPELAYWDRVDEYLIKKIAKNYYDNNRHFKYILYSYGFMLKRIDLEFAKSEVGLDETNPIFQNYIKGRDALEKILDNIGLSQDSTALRILYNQHLGLMSTSSIEETKQKKEMFRSLYTLQNFFLRKYLKEKNIDLNKSLISLNKMKILQSALSNISPFNGKG